MERVLVVCLVWAAMVAAALPGTKGCLEKERMGLIEFLKHVPRAQLTGFTRESDCCVWEGVNCSATTGRVQALTFCSSYTFSASPKYGGVLLNVSLFLPFEELLELNLHWCGLNGLINQQDLFKLTRLEKLSIHSNNLSNIVSLQAFANIKYLNLRFNRINIIDLKGICEMNSIIKLNLESNNLKGHLPPCIGNLTHLQVLYIGSNQMSGNIPSTIGNLSHLSSLSLQDNYWSGMFSLHSLANSSKLYNLDLSNYHNDFQVETETQSWFPSFQLSYLTLWNSNLNKMSNSIIPTFLLHQFELRYIDLSNNKLQDTFPSWLLQNNSQLGNLWMSNNFLTGNLILPNVIQPALKYLVISNNKLEGNLPSSFEALHQLRFLDLSFNSFSGTLPKTLFANNSSIVFVDLSNNLLHGEISLNITTLPSLETLLLRNNKFTRIIRELPSLNSSKLQVFDISNNLISAKLSNSIVEFSSLIILAISNNYFEGGIPDKLCQMSQLIYLDISYNNLFGSVPSCLRASSLQYLYMRHCNLSGVIPHELSINSSLIYIDLSYNHFSPSVFPNWIYSQNKLEILLMAGLGLEGEISMHLCGLEMIKILDLSHNNFNGIIPSCLFTRPFWVNESQDNIYAKSHLALGANSNSEQFGVEFMTKGTLRKFQGGILKRMNGLDLSSNKLSGRIPPQIGDSQAIHALNLSNNRLWGSIPSTISKLKQIESLDLSSNFLSGEIPPEISHLNSLSTFNVSNNNLSGPVPNGGLFSNFDEQNYGGNEFLCGPRLHKLCTTSSKPPEEQEDKDDETVFERTFFWWSFIAAYVTVFISVVVLLGKDTRCSRLWFRTVDVVCSKLLRVFAKLKCILGMK